MQLQGEQKKTSKNSVLYNINDFILNMLEYFRKLTLNDKTSAAESLDFHKKILSSIKKSEELMSEHLKNAENHNIKPIPNPPLQK